MNGNVHCDWTVNTVFSVTDCLVLVNSSFTGRCAERGGKTKLPHSSPELTSCHFFCEDGPKSKSSYLNRKHLMNS